MFEKFGYPEFSTNGEQIVTTYNGKYKDMLMDIRVYRKSAGEELNLQYEGEEMAVLLTSGKIEYNWEGNKAEASRTSVFEQGSYTLHVPKNVAVTVKVLEDAEILVQRTHNDGTFDSRLYTPDDVKFNPVWKDLCNGTAVRYVSTVFDYNSAPYSNMVVGEVISKQGCWSGYIPHHHPQPEVYYFKFDKPQGFGASFVGDDVFKITDGSFCAIPGGLLHPQVTAPGYQMYTCWMIRHFDGNPWTDRIDDEAHTWMLGKEFPEEDIKF